MPVKIELLFTRTSIILYKKGEFVFKSCVIIYYLTTTDYKYRIYLQTSYNKLKILFLILNLNFFILYILNYMRVYYELEYENKLFQVAYNTNKY